MQLDRLITPRWADFSEVDISTVWNSATPCQKGPRWKHLAESFLKTYRSVLAPSRLWSNRAWNTAAGGCDLHRRIR